MTPRQKTPKQNKDLERISDDHELPVNEWGRNSEDGVPCNEWGSGSYSNKHKGTDIYDEFGHSIYDWG